MSIVLNTVKEQSESAQPLLLVDLTLPDGSRLSLATHSVTWGGNAYHARVLQHNIDTIQALSPHGIDIPGSVGIVLADADKAMYQIDFETGFRGARLVATFLFYDIDTGEFSDSIVPFIGVCGRPDAADDTLTLNAQFILNLESKFLPALPVQKLCPKLIPITPEQWAMSEDSDSIYYACGVTGHTAPDCHFTKGLCFAPLRFGGFIYQLPPGGKSRSFMSGDWVLEVADQNIAKYGDYVPVGWGEAWVDCLVLGAYPDGNSTRGEAIVCEGRPVDIIQVTVNDEVLPPANDMYGTNYKVADPLFRYSIISRGDRDGALNMDAPWKGQGDPQGSICKIEWVVYSNVASGLPTVRALVRFPKIHKYVKIGTVTAGVVIFANNVVNRDVASNEPKSVLIFGNSNPDLNQAFSLLSWSWGPPGTVTLDGAAASSGTGGFLRYEGLSDDYAWVAMDILRRAGLQRQDADMDSFCDASNKFVRSVDYTTLHSAQFSSDIQYDKGEVVVYDGFYWASQQDGNTSHVPDAHDGGDWWLKTNQNPTDKSITSQHAMYKCSLVQRQRRSIADMLQGLLRGCGSHLGRNLQTGQIALFARGSIAAQQPAPIDGSNDNAPVNDGFLAYAFNESNIIRRGGLSTFRQIGQPVGSVANSVSVGFSDEDNAYAVDSLRVIDADDINMMNQEIAGSMTVDGCNALDRANRVGSIFLAEQIGGIAYEWQTTTKFIKGLVGHIVALSLVKYNFVKQLMRVVQIAPTSNWETMTIQARLHDDAWYADDLSMTSVNGTDPRRAPVRRPPWAWDPNLVQPATGDPLFDRSDWTFQLQVAWQLLKNGVVQAQLVIVGCIPVNQPANLVAPGVKEQGITDNAGGTIPGETVYSVALAGMDAAGLPGPISTLCQVAVAQVTDLNTITVGLRFWDAASTGWFAYAGTQSGRLTLAGSDQPGLGNLPGKITLTAMPIARAGAPDIQFDHLLVKLHIIEHYGPFAQQLTGVGTGLFTIAGAGWPAHQWTGYDCSILAKGMTAGVFDPLPVLNFHITDSDSDTLTVTPDPAAAGIVAGDLLSVLSIPVVDGANHRKISDANWLNTLSDMGAGLAPGAEVGRVLRVIAGKGRGYTYLIASNNATSVTIATDWVVLPDSTTRYVIEDAGTVGPVTPSAPQANGDPTAQITMQFEITNYNGKVLNVEVATVGRDGIESTPWLNPIRPIYIEGGQGTRTLTASDTQRVTDNVLLCDCRTLTGADATAGGITIQCLSNLLVGNAQLVIQKMVFVPPDGKTVTILPATGEAFADGATSIVLTDDDNVAPIVFHGI